MDNTSTNPNNPRATNARYPQPGVYLARTEEGFFSICVWNGRTIVTNEFDTRDEALPEIAELCLRFALAPFEV